MNHLICWRSSPRAGCSLTMSEISAAKVLIKSNIQLKIMMAAKPEDVVSLPVTAKHQTGSQPKGESTSLLAITHLRVRSRLLPRAHPM
jgi:hypothetical protein